MKNIAIFNEKFTKALSFAKKIAAQTKGRIATLPDLITLRTSNGLDSHLWDKWITPLTTIYFGVYQEKRLIVVAHHLGPLTTKKRIEEWVKSGEKDEKGGREKYGTAGSPKISQQEFNNLVEGKYGKVITINFDEYSNIYFDNYGVVRKIHVERAMRDPLIQALLGSSASAFIAHHFKISSDYANEHEKEEGSGYKILELSLRDRYGASLFYKKDQGFQFPETPIALRIILSRANRYSNNDLSIETELYTEEDLGYTRFVVMNNDTEDFVELNLDFEKDWEDCLVANDSFKESGLYNLCDHGNTLFVAYSKNGNVMDTGEPMFPITKIKKIGNETSFKTPDCLFFLKYHIDEVYAIKPAGANAYLVSGEVSPGQMVSVPVQFYKIEFDSSKRILKKEEIFNNLDLLLKINNISLEAEVEEVK